MFERVPDLHLVEAELNADIESQGGTALLAHGRLERLRELMVRGALENRVLSSWRSVLVVRRLSLLVGPTALRGDEYVKSPETFQLAVQYFQRLIEEADAD
jgi:hypothetical protein